MQEKLQVTIPASNKWHTEDIEEKAAHYGMEKSEFIMTAVDMMMNFDETFYKRIQGYSEGLHIPEWLVMQNMIIKRMADEAAEYEVFGPSGKVLDEFMLVGEGFKRRAITGEELFNNLKQQYKVNYEKKAVQELLKEEAYGIPLKENEKALLIKYRAGKTWLESDEYKKEQEAQTQYEEYKKKYGIELNNKDEFVTEKELKQWEKEGDQEWKKKHPGK